MFILVKKKVSCLDFKFVFDICSSELDITTLEQPTVW